MTTVIGIILVFGLLAEEARLVKLQRDVNELRNRIDDMELRG